jgi:hypothetical protein
MRVESVSYVRVVFVLLLSSRPAGSSCGRRSAAVRSGVPSFRCVLPCELQLDTECHFRTQHERMRRCAWTPKISSFSRQPLKKRFAEQRIAWIHCRWRLVAGCAGAGRLLLLLAPYHICHMDGSYGHVTCHYNIYSYYEERQKKYNDNPTCICASSPKKSTYVVFFSCRPRGAEEKQN